MDNAAIEFVILVAHQFLIEKAHFVEDFAPETAERHSIDPHFMVGADAEVRIAHPEGGAHSVRDGPTFGRVLRGQGVANASHIVRTTIP